MKIHFLNWFIFIRIHIRAADVMNILILILIVPFIVKIIVLFFLNHGIFCLVYILVSQLSMLFWMLDLSFIDWLGFPFWLPLIISVNSDKLITRILLWSRKNSTIVIQLWFFWIHMIIIILRGSKWVILVFIILGVNIRSSSRSSCQISRRIVIYITLHVMIILLLSTADFCIRCFN